MHDVLAHDVNVVPARAAPTATPPDASPIRAPSWEARSPRSIPRSSRVDCPLDGRGAGRWFADGCAWMCMVRPRRDGKRQQIREGVRERCGHFSSGLSGRIASAARGSVGWRSRPTRRATRVERRCSHGDLAVGLASNGRERGEVLDGPPTAHAVSRRRSAPPLLPSLSRGATSFVAPLGPTEAAATPPARTTVVHEGRGEGRHAAATAPPPAAAPCALTS